MVRPQKIIMPMHMLELKPYVSHLEFQSYVAHKLQRSPSKEDVYSTYL